MLCLAGIIVCEKLLEFADNITERFKNGSKPMGDYVKKKRSAPIVMNLFEGEETASTSKNVNDSLVTYDLFKEI